MSLKENEIKELKKRGFDTADLEPRPKRKRSFEIDFEVSLRGILICIAIILFVMMLLFIPQCIYYMKVLENLEELGL